MQTTSTATRATRTAQRTKSANALPYPKLPQSDTSPRLQFWLAAWARDLAEYEAFRAFIATKAVNTQRNKSDRLGMAFSGACIAMEDSLGKSAQQVRDAGGILFAWPGSTMLQQGGAA